MDDDVKVKTGVRWIDEKLAEGERPGKVIDRPGMFDRANSGRGNVDDVMALSVVNPIVCALMSPGVDVDTESRLCSIIVLLVGENRTLRDHVAIRKFMTHGGGNGKVDAG